MTKKCSVMILVLFAFFFDSCSLVKFARYYTSADAPSGKLRGKVYESENKSYIIGELGDSWKRIGVDGGDIAFLNEEIGATITVDSTCDKKGNYSLKALSESLLIGIEDKQLIERNELMISGENALSSVYTGKLDGIPLKLNAVVFKKDSCIYDFTYVSSPESFGSGIGDFQEFISKFRVRERVKE